MSRQNNWFASTAMVFPPWLEIANIILGFAFGIAAFIQWYFFGLPQPGTYYGPMASFVLNILLLNITHNAFSWMLPMTVPEVREWWRGERIFGLSITQMMLVVLVLSTALVFATDIMMSIKGYGRAGYVVAALFTFGWNLIHLLGQIFGFNVLYDQRLRRLYGEFDARTLSIHRWQRRIFQWIFAIFLFRLVVSLLFQSRGLFHAYNFWISLIAFVIVLFLIVLAFLETNGKHSWKPYYLVRLLPLCFIGFDNPWVLYANFVLHSLEHLSLCGLMVKNSYEKGERRHQRYWSLAILLMLGFVLLALTRHFIFGGYLMAIFPDSKWTLKLIAAISTSLSMTHFFLDRMEFRMKSPLVRKQIAPLLER